MTRLRRMRDGGEVGFTLIEMLVVLLLTSVVGTVAMQGMITGMRVTQRQSSRVEALNEVKKSFERVTRDIRGANPLITAESTRIKVREVEAGVRRDVTYSLVGQNLVVTEVKANHKTGVVISTNTKTVMGDVEVGTAVVFTYFDATGAELTAAMPGVFSPLEAEAVEMRLRVELDRSDDLVDFSERITMRNAEA